ncbi:HNH endonuclease family protein [Sphingomonas qomolangmaensis]|uniref:TIGR02646 family protein n=1 Tax=Sphingomonas qomolangmaensis TaxID=2918765 RepID=A0ABY5LE70_9SPHN|nr:hypothetical protein [Sphingomonas qomolangmaensis]UUL84079.1 hypothetical protein NMP03_07820 [Sphingomonas qomolangmaensis]
MLKIAVRDLPESALKTLNAIQAIVDKPADYPARVAKAKSEWDAKISSNAKKDAFKTIRETLAKMCVGSARCSYCEDSLADEIEHIQPKNLFPEHAFVWGNYLFACGPCNGPKSNRYGVLNGTIVDEFMRGRNDAVVPPAAGVPGFIDPRTEDPFSFLEIDLGGVTPGGTRIQGTFDILPLDGLGEADLARATFTIDVLGLNREAIREARKNAFGGFSARMHQYVASKENEADAHELAHLETDLLKTPHLSVFEDIRRQRSLLPDLLDLFARAPEMLDWKVVPDAAT